MKPPTETVEVIDALETFARREVGHAATIERMALRDGFIPWSRVNPRNPQGCSIDIVGEQALIVQLGSGGSRWELGYSGEDLLLGRDVIAAAIASRVVERSAWGRSRVTVTFADGRTARATAGNLSSLLPLPGWTRWGHLTVYQPYLSADRGE